MIHGWRNSKNKKAKMHYYKRDIGQYYKKAGRLTMLQHGAYTMLMDACYDREIFPTVEQAIDWCWASADEEIEAVKFILSKFFFEHDGVFKQRHITEVLEKYHENAAINKAIAIEREAKRRAKNTKREPIVNEPPPNKELRTTNNQLQTKEKIKRFKKPSLSEVQEYIAGKNYQIDAESFISFYDSNGWKVGKNPMKSWKAALTTWQKRNKGQNNGSYQQNHKPSLAERLETNRKRAIEQLNK